jgi:hypothetical protein
MSINYSLNNIDSQKVIPYTYPIIKFFYERIYEAKRIWVTKGGERFPEDFMFQLKKEGLLPYDSEELKLITIDFVS